MLSYINSLLDKMDGRTCLKVTIICALLFGFIDYAIGPELSFSVFYTIPIMAAVWYGNKWSGVVVAIVSSLAWLAADIAAGNTYSSYIVLVWNTTVRFCYFLIILWLLAILREKLALEEDLADTDQLTGMSNRRAFYERLDQEYSRYKRYPAPITIAYIDLDNFKKINDNLGHATGDALLQVVANKILNSIRKSDIAARLGGDEFAIIFPGLQPHDSVTIISKLNEELLSAMRAERWKVTFSIGAITFTELTESHRDMLKRVDDLMYTAKKSGKNNLIHQIWPNLS